MKKIIYLNGKFVKERDAQVSIFDPGFLYGFGLFETVRARQGNIINLDAHIERLNKSAQLINLNLAVSCGKMKSIVRGIAAKNASSDLYIRLTLWESERRKKSNFLVFAKPYHPPAPRVYNTGYNCCISIFKQDEQSILSRVKSTNYLKFHLAYQQARQNGFDESLILNRRGDIAECSRANIFLVKNNKLFTPSLDCGCLSGITRRIILDLAKRLKIKSYQTRLSVQDLKKAEEAFLTNSLIGVMPIRSCSKKLINCGNIGDITKRLMEKYSSLYKLRDK